MTEELGRAMTEYARRVISAALGDGPVPDFPQEAPWILPGAVFVTLRLNGQLRGCIGSLQAFRSLGKDLEVNSLNAAFRDPRFPGVTRELLPRLSLEVSVLTKPQDLRVSDLREFLVFLEKIRPGVILSQGTRSATFLPQVWEQIPNPEDFLENLGKKAGLESTAWKENSTNFQIYQVEKYTQTPAQAKKMTLSTPD